MGSRLLDTPIQSAVDAAKRGLLLGAFAQLLLAPPAMSHDRAAVLDAAAAAVSAADLSEHAGLLAADTLEGREAGSRGGRAAARYIETRLKAAGLKPAGDGGSYVQRFNPNYQNLIGLVPGADPALRDQYVLIGAHYDHVGYGNRRNSYGPFGYIHNGADDNASGVSTLLEVVDSLTSMHWQPRRSVLFAFWDGEEINLLGSRHWVQRPTVPLGKLKMAVNIDMVGRMVNGRLEVGGTRTGFGLRRLMSTPALPDGVKLDFTWEYKDNSDHWPLFEAGIPSLILHTGLHSDYHRPSDDVEKLNVAGMQQTAIYLVDAIGRVADADELPEFRSAARSETPWTQRQREAPLPPAPGRLGLNWDWQDLQGKRTMVVKRVNDGGPAARAGLKAGDRLLAVDGRPIVDDGLLPAAVLQAESTIRLTVARGAEAASIGESVEVKLDGSRVGLGVSWREDPAAPGAVFVTRVVPYSPAARAGLAMHDRIYAVDGAPFADGAALLDAIRQRTEPDDRKLQLEVESAGRSRTITVDLQLPTNDADAST
jgi:Zn-dependent M28 family amino/carboxypeptidase